MSENQDINGYEQLHEMLTKHIETMHARNKLRIRIGFILMFILPFILAFVRWLTDSDKVFFLIVWVICLFALSVYLVGVEHLDHYSHRSMDKMLAACRGEAEPSEAAAADVTATDVTAAEVTATAAADVTATDVTAAEVTATDVTAAEATATDVTAAEEGGASS